MSKREAPGVEHTFRGIVRPNSIGEFKSHAIEVPREAIAAIPVDQLRGRPRIVATINGHTTHCALIPGGEGTFHILASKSLQKAIGATVGQEVVVSFRFDDPDHVTMPEELAQSLAANSSAMALWEKLTPGKKRGFAHRVSSAKQAATRTKRAAEVIESLFPLRFGGLGRSRETEENPDF